MSDLAAAIFDSHRTGAAFLLTDLDLAMTFLDLANTSRIAGIVRRNRRNARTAYDSVLRFLPRLVLTAAERQRIEEKLSELKGRLEAVGEQV
jgi:hypothetical protein